MFWGFLGWVLFIFDFILFWLPDSFSYRCTFKEVNRFSFFSHNYVSW